MPTSREWVAFLIGFSAGQVWPRAFHVDRLWSPSSSSSSCIALQKAANPAEEEEDDALRWLSKNASETNFTTEHNSSPLHESNATDATAAATTTTTRASLDTETAEESPWSWVWDVVPFQHTTPPRRFVHSKFPTDTFTPFHAYFDTFHQLRQPHAVDFPDLPGSHWWIHYFEPYHNHLHRFRGAQRVVVMEIGVQSGGKIAMLRNYLGPGMEYVGIDINPVVKTRFETADWIHIEIGNAGKREFLIPLKEKYPQVDIFIDDGGHTMDQQTLAMELMLPHVQPEGVYICEDLATSWWANHGGVRHGDVRNPLFVNQTTVGLVHRMMDWLNANWKPGLQRKRNYMGPGHDRLSPSFFPESWWQTVPQQVKHIHYYNQLVVFEKGLTYNPADSKTVGIFMPYMFRNNVYNTTEFPPVDWPVVLAKLAKLTNSPYYSGAGA